MVVGETAFARHRLTNGNAGTINELAQRLCGLSIDDAAPGNNQRALAGANQRRRLFQRMTIGAIARDMPDAAGEERSGVCKSLGLYVLGQGQRDGPGLRRAGQHAHRFRQSRQQLFGPRDAIPVAADGLEGIIDGNILRMLGL